MLNCNQIEKYEVRFYICLGVCGCIPVRDCLPYFSRPCSSRLYGPENSSGTGKIYLANKQKDKKLVLYKEVEKNPAYGRQSISRPMRIVAPIPQ